MLRPGKGPDQGKIRLPRQSVAPGVRELQALYEQAKENRGREVELIWQVPGTYKTYSILVRFDRVTPHPLWQVWEDNGRENKMVWRFETSDINMIFDVIAMLDVSHQKTTGTVQTLNQSQTGLPLTGAPGTPPSGITPRNTGSFPALGQTAGQSRGLVGSSGAVDSGIFSTNTPPQAAGYPPQPPANPTGTGTGWRTVDEGGWKGGDSGWKAADQGTSSGTWKAAEPTQANPFSAGGGANPNMASSGTWRPAGQPGPDPGQFPAPASGPGFGGGVNPLQAAMANLAAGQPPPNTPPLPSSQSLLKANAPVPPQPSPQAALAGGAGQAMPEGSLPADFFSDAPATIAGAAPAKTTSIQGSIEQNPLNSVLTNIGMQQLTGKLEVMGDTAVGHVYFENGIPKDAQTSTNRGDDAIKELVTWRRGTYLFKNGLRTEMSSVEKSLQTTLLEGVALLDQLKHLEKAGLVYESILVQKQKNLGEPELKLMLAKGHPLDFQMQKNAYDSLKHKKTFTDLLRDNPMDQTQWAPLLFNLLYCGLIEIKPPAATRGGALDFLGEGKQIIQNLAYNFVRPDTGIVSFEALLYFLEYEFYRYEAYNWPMSLVAFEMSLRRPGSNIGETEPLPPQALATAAMRIGLVKRPLDLLTHFQVNEYAILMPNTKASQAAFVANRILDALTVTPLAPGIDRANISLSFGVANLPSDGEDVESLLQAAEQARLEAREGNFPIVLARTGKKE